MTIQICGGGCPNCDKLEKNAKLAAAELGLEADFEKVKDWERIAAMGVMSTPALAVDGVVLSSGRVLKADQAAELLKAHLAKAGS